MLPKASGEPPSAVAPLAVHHEPTTRRFVARTPGGEAVLEYRWLDLGTLDYHHTFVPAALRGAGIASQLTECALRYARDNGLKVIPTCPFVARYVARHPEFQPRSD
jgi:predicted GNAT family acetyltransferase